MFLREQPRIVQWKMKKIQSTVAVHNRCLTVENTTSELTSCGSCLVNFMGRHGVIIWESLLFLPPWRMNRIKKNKKKTKVQCGWLTPLCWLLSRFARTLTRSYWLRCSDRVSYSLVLRVCVPKVTFWVIA